MKSGIYWIASYYKSGNTWFRIFLSNLLENGDQPSNINNLTTDTLASARSWIDNVLCFGSSDLTEDEIERLRPDVYRWSIKEGGVFYCKIHDAYTYIDGEPLVSYEATLGAVYIMRNPLDIAVSLAAHFQISIDQSIEIMANLKQSPLSQNKLRPVVRQRALSWSDHVRSWLDNERVNVEWLRYEDMKLNPLETFTRAACFLGLPNDAERINKAIRFSDFGELQRQESSLGFRERIYPEQRFFRQGRIGDWQDNLSNSQVEQIISDHFEIMHRFGYSDDRGNPLEEYN